jgi:hypothetical protein
MNGLLRFILDGKVLSVGGELVEASLSYRRGAGLGSGAGVAGGNSLFFASPKKSKQKKGDPGSCVPTLRYGQPAVLGPGGVSLNSLRSNNAIPDPPEPALLGASTRANRERGRGLIPTGTRHGESLFLLVFGGLSLAVRYWYSFPTPCGCAEERRARRIRAHACLSRRRVCMRPRLDRAPQVAPERSAGDAATRVAFSLVTFFWRSKRKLLACRATPGQQRSEKSTKPGTRTNPRSALLNGDRSCSK